MTTKTIGLSIIVFSGGFDRVHYALSMAAAAAINRAATLFFSGRALRALLPNDGWQTLNPADDGTTPAVRNTHFAAAGIATWAELFSACTALNVTIMACEMGLRAEGLTLQDLRQDIVIQPGGLVTLYQKTEGQLVFV